MRHLVHSVNLFGLNTDCLPQPCQNVPAAGNFVAFSQFLAAYSTLDFTRSPLAGKGTWCLLPTTPSMLPSATQRFDRAVTLSLTRVIGLARSSNKKKKTVTV